MTLNKLQQPFFKKARFPMMITKLAHSALKMKNSAIKNVSISGYTIITTSVKDKINGF